MDDSFNDNHAARPHDGAAVPDAHGQAALLLVESLIHGLIARSVLSVADAVEIVDVAADVKVEIASDLGDTPSTMRRSIRLLTSVGESLRRDLSHE